MSQLNIIFAGTPEFAARHLEALLATDHNICAVYTQPDRPAGRGKKLTPSPVKKLAIQHNLRVMQPESLKSEESQAELARFDCDLMVVVAYGLLLPKAVLDIPKQGCINVHGSVLPRWRGAAPIQRAVEAGDEYSGVTIMQMDVGLDTGDMLLIRKCPIHPTDTSTDLHDRLADIGPPALVEAIEQIATGAITRTVQDDTLSNYAKKIEKAEAEIDWTKPAPIIDRQIRAFNPFPICYSTLNGERLKIHKATLTTETADSEPGSIEIHDGEIRVHCGNGVIALDTLQLPGKKAMSSHEFLNGFAHLLNDAGQFDAQ